MNRRRPMRRNVAATYGTAMFASPGLSKYRHAPQQEYGTSHQHLHACLPSPKPPNRMQGNYASRTENKLIHYVLADPTFMQTALKLAG